MGHTLTQTEQNTSENGKMINKTDMELRNGQMEKSTKDSIRTEPKLVKEFLGF